MKPQSCIINICLAIFCYGQTIRAQSLDADSLMVFEHRIYKESDSTKKQLLLLEKIRYCLRLNHTGEQVYNDMQRLSPGALPDTIIRARFLWNAALVAYLNRQNDRAAHYLQSYFMFTKNHSTETALLRLLIHASKDTVLVRSELEALQKTDAEFATLHCITQAGAYERKHKNLYMISSALLPGSGTMLNGAVMKGLGSLLLVSSSVYGVVQLVEYGLYLNAILWGTGVGLKFYTGNILLTEKQFYKKENEERTNRIERCEDCLVKLLSKYPLNLKL